MYLGSNPGNIGQISFYDAARGECYCDFGDPIGVMSRALVQGLFGIIPDAMNSRLILRPGFPQTWNHASISAPDIDFSFKSTKNSDIYNLKQHFDRKLAIDLQLKAYSDSIKSVTINGKPTAWKLIEAANGFPMISILVADSGKIEINWVGKSINQKSTEKVYQKGGEYWISFRCEII